LTASDAKVAKGVAALYLANMTTLALNTLFLVLLANYYASQQVQVGLVSFLNVVLVSAATFSVLALPLVGSGVVATPPAVTRFLSIYEGSGRGVYFLSLGICGVISTAIVALSAYSPLASLVAGPPQTNAVLFACIDALVYSFGQLGAYALLGSDMATVAGRLIVVSSALRYAFASIMLLLGMGPAGVFIGFALGDVFLAVFANLEAFRGLPPSSGKFNSSPVLKYMLSVFFAALMGLAVAQSDKLLAFLQLGLPPLAIYNIATVGAAVASFVPAAATNVLVPSLSGFGSRETERVTILKAYTRHISLTAIPIGFELAALSPFLLRIFGEAYSSGAPVMAIIAISMSFTAVASVYSSSLLVDDKAHHFTLSNLLGLAALLFVALVAVPLFGFFGIALGRAAMLLVILGSTAYFVHRAGRLVLDAPAYAKSLLASALMGGFVYALLSLATLSGVTRLGVVVLSFVMIPVGFAAYLLIMKALRAYTDEDMNFIETLLPSRIRFLSRLARHLL
jgi:O-antigen/teichoic acid export membrane protein